MGPLNYQANKHICSCENEIFHSLAIGAGTQNKDRKSCENMPLGCKMKETGGNWGFTKCTHPPSPIFLLKKPYSEVQLEATVVKGTQGIWPCT